MKIDQHGWLSDSTHKPSPNHNDRPENTAISLLVVHSISLPPGRYDGCFIEDFFQNKLVADQHPYFSEIADQKVSSHILIKRDGSIIQFVSLLKRAWHAGVSCFDGADDCNDFSIGIELEGTDHTAFENAQYLQLAEITNAIKTLYPEINLDRIVGHSDVAPIRKTDPGTEFDWRRFRALLD